MDAKSTLPDGVEQMVDRQALCRELLKSTIKHAGAAASLASRTDAGERERTAYTKSDERALQALARKAEELHRAVAAFAMQLDG